MRRWLVTGASGFIGARVARLLAAEGDEKVQALMARWRTTEALLGPVLIVIGVCMTLVTYIADYQEAGSSLASIEKLLNALPK